MSVAEDVTAECAFAFSAFGFNKIQLTLFKFGFAIPYFRVDVLLAGKYVGNDFVKSYCLHFILSCDFISEYIL